MSCYGDKPAEFLALQPNGQIPVAIIEGQVLRLGNPRSRWSKYIKDLQSNSPRKRNMTQAKAFRRQDSCELYLAAGHRTQSSNVTDLKTGEKRVGPRTSGEEVHLGRYRSRKCSCQ